VALSFCLEVLGMNIANFTNLWLGLGIIFLLLLLYLQKAYNQGGIFRFLSDDMHRYLLFKGYSRTKSLFAIVLFTLSLLAAFMSLLRISWGEQKVNVKQCGRAVLFALDISRSMLAADVSPSRLEMAKVKIRSAINNLGPERVGLLLFAESAVLACPFTSDFKTFLSFLDQIDSSTICSSAKTSLTGAFLKAIEIFNRAKVASRILVMITDGEDFSQGGTVALDKAKEEHIALLALGVGTTQGAPVPVIDSFGKVVGHETDAKGQIILTKLDEEGLLKTVTHLGGNYVRLTYANEDLRSVENFVERFEKEHFDDASFVIKNETYPIFAAFASLLLLLEAAIG